MSKQINLRKKLHTRNEGIPRVHLEGFGMNWQPLHLLLLWWIARMWTPLFLHKHRIREPNLSTRPLSSGNKPVTPYRTPPDLKRRRVWSGSVTLIFWRNPASPVSWSTDLITHLKKGEKKKHASINVIVAMPMGMVLLIWGKRVLSLCCLMLSCVVLSRVICLVLRPLVLCCLVIVLSCLAL
jgi:hypothetical protein